MRPGFDAIHQCRPVVAAVAIARKARIADPFGMADHAHQALKRFFARDRQHDIAIGGRDRAEHRPRGRRHRELRPLHLVERQGQHQFQHRHVDVLAFAGDRALVERGRDGAERIGAGEDVGMIDAAIIRPLAARLVGEMRHVVTGGGMDDGRIGRQLRRGAGLAVARDRAIDQFRVERAQRLMIELQAAHHAGAEILDQDVRGCDQAAHRLCALLRFEVEHEALLADIELAEGRGAAVAHRRAGPHRLALGGLDLDDLGAHVGQHPRAMWTCDGGRKIEHAQARIAPCQMILIELRYCHSQILPDRRRSGFLAAA